MEELVISINHSVGLHARPAAEFVRVAASFPCDLRVSNLTTETETVNAKSILGILTLGVCQGHEIKIQADGENATEAIIALRELVESNFGE